MMIVELRLNELLRCPLIPSSLLSLSTPRLAESNSHLFPVLNYN